MARFAADFLARRPTQGFGRGLTMAEGLCAQRRLVRRLRRFFGPPAGYKVGLTNPAVQKRFGIGAPVRGVLLRGMLRPEGTVMPARFGARPVFEADLLVTVKDGGIHGARTPAEALRHLSAVTPFIELADLALAPGAPLDGPGVAAINVGARYGIAGRPRRVAPDAAFSRALARMQVVVTDGTGGELSRARGSALLGHPLNAVLWLARDLERSGRRLRAGEVISLGSFSRPLPPRPGQRVEVRYEGLPGGTLRVGVRFR